VAQRGSTRATANVISTADVDESVDSATLWPVVVLVSVLATLVVATAALVGPVLGLVAALLVAVVVLVGVRSYLLAGAE
jgi:hypothetical protein